MIYKRLFLFFFGIMSITLSAHSEELTRLDTLGVEEVIRPEVLIHLNVSENCSVCEKQIITLSECIAPERVQTYISGVDEEKLRKYIKRKKYPYKVFYLNDSTRTKLLFGPETPSMTIQKNNTFLNFKGYQNCQRIISVITEKKI